MNEITGTATQLAKKLGTDYATANTLLKYLVKKGVVKDAGERKNLTGKGKPSRLYTIPTTLVTLNLLEEAA